MCCCDYCGRNLSECSNFKEVLTMVDESRWFVEFLSIVKLLTEMLTFRREVWIKIGSVDRRKQTQKKNIVFMCVAKIFEYVLKKNVKKLNEECKK